MLKDVASGGKSDVEVNYLLTKENGRWRLCADEILADVDENWQVPVASSSQSAVDALIDELDQAPAANSGSASSPAAVSPAESSSPAVSSPNVVSPAGSPEECLQRWMQFGNSMVSNGYVSDSGIQAASCGVLQNQVTQLVGAGCPLDDSMALAEGLSQASTAAYRRCQQMFPENWDKMCLAEFRDDYQIGQ